MTLTERLLDAPTPSLEELAAKHGVGVHDLRRELEAGLGVEGEHTSDPDLAEEIALDHLGEDPQYYTKLARAGL